MALRKHSGEIVRLVDPQQFGFIKDAEGTTHFFHASFVKGEPFSALAIGDQVEFVPFVGPRGRRAEDVRVTRKINPAQLGPIPPRDR